MVVYKEFQVGNSFFVYDREKNTIITITEDEYRTLSDRRNPNWKSVIGKYQLHGFLQETILENIRHPADRWLDDLKDTQVESMVIQVTQDCNLRCSYCYYVNEEYTNRHHSKKNMTEDTAIRSLDYFIEHSKGHEEIALGFYGGEPLLQFELIKKCVLYIKNHVDDRTLLFSITSNGTLLTDEIIEFFIEHDFKLMISLDGTQDTHDRNRVFANGTGSYNVIMKKIRHVKEKYPDFFSKVLFNTVASPEMDMRIVRQHYLTDDLMKNAQIAVTVVQEFYKDTPSDYGDNYYIDYNYNRFKALLGYSGRLSEDEFPSSLRMMSNKYHRLEEDLHREFTMSKTYHHGGPCIAGCRRIFVDVDGGFYPCESSSEHSSVMNIGHVNSGVDVEKVRTILNVGKVTEDECKACWAIIHCRICAGSVDNLSELSREKKMIRCRSERETVLNDFRDFCVVKELKGGL